MWVTFDESSQGNEEKVLHDTSLFVFWFMFSFSHCLTHAQIHTHLGLKKPKTDQSTVYN